MRRILANDFVQRPVKQMRDGVVALDRAASRGVHRHTNSLAHFGSAASRQHAPVNENVALLLRVRDLQAASFRPVRARHMNETGIADLTAHLGVTGGAIHDQIKFILRSGRRHRFDHGLGLEKVVAQEFCRFDLEILFGDADHFLFLSPSRAGSLFFHELFKARDIHRHPTLASHQLGKVERESIGVVEFESPLRKYPRRQRSILGAAFLP